MTQLELIRCKDDVDPIELSRAMRDALKLTSGGPMYRVRNGWRGTGTRRVGLEVMTRLRTLGLVAYDEGKNHTALAITPRGEQAMKGIRL